MKNKEQIKYLAQALFNVSQNKTPKQIDAVNDNLLKLLRAQGRLGDLPELVSLVKDLQLRQQGKVKIKVSSFYALKDSELKLVAKLAKQLSDQEVELEQKVDSGLIGGVVLRYQDKLIDLSLRQKLNKLNEALIN